MFKFRNGWSDASSDWLPRRTCFRGGISLPARISCSKGRNFERSRCKVSQISTGYSEKDCLCMPLLFVCPLPYKGNPSRCNLCLSEKLCILTSQNFSLFEQEIRAGNEMPPRKQVLRGNQSEEASLQPFLNLNIYN